MARVAQAVDRQTVVRPMGADNGPDLMQVVLGNAQISVNIPENASLSDVESTLQAVITGYSKLSEAAEKMKPIIGRILLTVSTRRLYRPQYKNFTAFVTQRVVGGMGLGRSNAFEALKIAKAFPALTTDEYQTYGASRLLAAASVIDETHTDYKQILDKSTRMTVDAFRAEVQGLREPSNRAKPEVISIRTSAESKARWQAILAELDLGPSEAFDALLGMYKTPRGKRTTATAPAHAKAA